MVGLMHLHDINIYLRLETPKSALPASTSVLVGAHIPTAFRASLHGGPSGTPNPVCPKPAPLNQPLVLAASHWPSCSEEYVTPALPEDRSLNSERAAETHSLCLAAPANAGGVGRKWC